MVFATDFDPYDELSRPNAASAERLSTAKTQSVPNEGQAKYQAKQQADSNDSSNVIPLHLSGTATRVKIENRALLLPRKPKLPLGLQILNRLQQGSAVITGMLVAGALVVYGSTVYVDKSTSRALVQLDELQGESQQLTSANESIKQSLAEQAAREDSGLEPYEADDVILLTPAPSREGAAPADPAPELPGPLGY